MIDAKEFAKFEEREGLFDRKYAGIPYWQYLRVPVYYFCSGNFIIAGTVENHKGTARNKSHLFQVIKILAQREIKGIKSELALKKQPTVDVILFRTFVGPDRFYDYWKLPEEITAVRIMRSIRAEEEISPGILTMGFPYVKYSVNRRILKNLHRMAYDKKEFQFLKELEQKIICCFRSCLTAEQMQEKVQDYLLIKRIFQRYYSKLFDRLKPHAIVVSCYTNPIFHAAYEEAKKRRIKIIELQHCLITRHYEYWFEDQRGKNNLTPDYMLMFGRIHETWAKLLKNTTCVSVGFPFQEHELKRLEKCEADEKMVIVYPTPDERFEAVISEFADKAEPLGYKVIIKVHPGEDNLVTFYPLLSKKKNLEITTNQSESIYYWLKRGKHHVLAETTVGYEALAVEGSNICIAQNVEYGMMQPLLEWGVARGFQTADELLELVCHPLETDAFHRREVWAENASENVERFFRQMQEQGWPDGKDFQQ